MLNPTEIIIQKRDGQQLTKQELQSMVNGYIQGDIPDYQMSSFLMAVFFKGMADNEIQALTETYINSGKRISFDGDTVDKHSTGGIGDKISLMLAPIVAECGGIIPMISGRGLGHTGGTLDKLEAIPGLRTDLSEKEFRNVINKVGFSIISQSSQLVPADKKVYALRDVTGTVESIPLITASIISKKIVEGAKNLVIDLKVGDGAFIQDIESGKELSRLLVATGSYFGQKVEVVFSNMNSPIGNYIGNGAEVYETISYLSGESIPDIDNLTKHLAVKMLRLTNICESEEEAYVKVCEAISSGKALKRFCSFIKAQGGDETVCEQPELLFKTKYTVPITAKSSGWVKKIDCRRVGYSLLHIDAGRKELSSKLNHRAGVYLEPTIGSYIDKDSEIGKVFCDDKRKGVFTADRIAAAYFTVEDKVDPESIILI